MVPAQPRNQGCQQSLGKSPTTSSEKQVSLSSSFLCIVDMADGEKEATQKDGKADPCKSKDLRDSWWIKSQS